MAHILDGKMVAAKVKREVAETLKANDLHASLAVVLVGDDLASHIYVEHKNKDCEECGVFCRTHWIDGNFKQDFVTNYVQSLAHNNDVDGILVQLPLPEHMDAAKVLAEIPPEKDVDCFTTANIGRLYSGDAFLKPCTPAGVMRLLDEYGIPLSGKHCVVLGRSNVVGKPMAQLLLDENATVTVCHSKTENLRDICRSADVLISAVGRPGLVTRDMVKDGAVIVDVGMNRNADGKLCGDCTREAYEASRFYTPVPGGVGPMTRAMLMQNVMMAAANRRGLDLNFKGEN